MRKWQAIVAPIIILILTACAAKIDATYHNNQTGISEYITGTTTANKLYLRTESGGISQVTVKSDGKFDVDLVPRTYIQTIELSDTKAFADPVSVQTDAVQPITAYDGFARIFNGLVEIDVGEDAIEIPSATDGLESVGDGENLLIQVNVQDDKLLGFNIYTETRDEPLFVNYVRIAATALGMNQSIVIQAYNKALEQTGQYLTATSNDMKLTFILAKNGSMNAFARVK